MTPDWIWKSALGRLEMKVAKASFETFLKDTEGISLNSNILTVMSSSLFAAEFLQQRLIGIIEEAVESVANQKYSIVFQVGNHSELMTSTGSNIHVDENSSNSIAEKFITTDHLGYSELKLNYSFNSFAIGPSNKFAFSAISTAANGDFSFNPILVYSNAGLGKTHLILSAQKKIISEGSNCLYITSEQFMRGFVNSVRKNDVESFRIRYESLDALLIDDIQFLNGKDQTQDILYHIFNSMHQKGKQIILTSDCAANELIGFTPRLKSRFEWGLSVNIQPPDFNTAVEILRIKSQEKGIELSDKILEMIAHRYTRNVRELEGLLNRIMAFMQYNKKNFDESTISSLLGEASTLDKTALSPQQVCRVVAEYYHTQDQALVGRGGDKEVLRARNAAIYILREDNHLSFKSIGNIFDGRDHSTVHSAWGKFSQEADGKDISGEITDIRRLISNFN
jgi:chromosomal replication initiator protein